MNTNFLQVCISAENIEQADSIMNALLADKLIVGGQMHHSPARFLWKGSIMDMPYITIVSFCRLQDKDKVVQLAEQKSAEEVPMIWFSPLDGNQKLLNWLQASLEN